MNNYHHRVSRRIKILRNHLRRNSPPATAILNRNNCLSYSPPELSDSNPITFDVTEMRRLTDGHNLDDRDRLFGLITQSGLFNRRELGGRVFVSPDYNQSMEQQREMTMKRIEYLFDRGVFRGWLTGDGPRDELRKLALHEVIGMYDHSLAIMLGVFLWGGAIKFLGTKPHHDKWLRAIENYEIKGCIAMSELGHGSNVRGIETVTTYDSNSGEFIINTPCESAQKYWIGGAANHATHTVVLSQLHINGKNQGVHAFIAQIRDSDGNICPNIRIADCGHKTGLNGVDNGRIWFDNARIPRENLLNSVADVSSSGEYLSAIKNADQRFAAFLSPLTYGRVTISVGAVYISKIALAITIRYALTRRAFSIAPNGPEVLLLDYPSHQRRLLPLLAKVYAMSFAAIELKMMYANRTPESKKAIHIFSSAYKATFTWNNMRTLQECREACGGQGVKTENRIGHFMSEFDVHSTFEGDNNVLMQQMSKTLLAEYITRTTKNEPFRGLGLEHMNKPWPVIPSQLTSSAIRSSEFQIDLFHLRERDLLRRFAAEVSEYQSHGKSKESAFILSYQLAEDLGRAFSERAILKTFMEAESTLSAGSVKNVLGLLRSLYAMMCVDEDASFLRYGYLSIENASAVRKEVPKLCSELRPLALALVSSFGIPDAFLSPIAYNWVDSNSWDLSQH
ncbi:acyl-coenzyme A oxidase 3, peroxisomal-like isoform X1 [Lotus japonicus]|uniref:acyl-coenzyme A oxidase 3, peroxisomal-like isoform X1 n=1 Tax=Lotus japonicus TaxID=34305 RepID=UPI002589D409|nr:acyl-coenzyme A oxidase 3, peroxisomal-like isoform X1 [Lotus japonicus]